MAFEGGSPMSGFSVPVAIFNFNRPHLTRRVFEVVRQIRPRQLLLVADGPRASRPDDARLCAEVRAIFDEIDWECEVLRNFSDTNLGSFKRNSSGLNWVFDTVEEAIILEDDCMPSLSFFRYCEELLERYRNDPRVGLISGNNFGFPGVGRENDSYYFSAYALTWGWASWRRVWKQVDLEMSWWEPEAAGSMLRAALPHPSEWKYWLRLYDSIRSGATRNAWDYQLIITLLRHSQYCAFPQVNLAANVGFGVGATHGSDDASPVSDLPRGELTFPLMHPVSLQRSASIDHRIFHRRFVPTLWQRIKNKLVRTRNQIRRRLA